MRLVSINVGMPREVISRGKVVTTGIFKEPVTGAVMLRTANLDGDRQADLLVHGGASKAVYAYPVEHYQYWQVQLPGMYLPPGMFGENFTTEGLIEEEVNIGDRFSIGEAEVVVTQPRLPCYKLGIKFGRDDMVKKFLASRRTGFYLAVVGEGIIEAGDKIELLGRNKHNVSVADITRLYAFEKDDLETMKRAVEVDSLTEDWRTYFQDRIEKLKG
jgi:MOSC domain-containing protein YiiM